VISAGILADLDALLREVAAAEIMPRFRNLSAADVRTKSGPLDLVTEADVAAERTITAGLERLLPGCFVLGEEAASEDPSLLERLADAELAVTLDPIDGTSNFAAGVPLFGTMAAIIEGGEITGSVIHDPVCGDSVLALRGHGAWREAPDGARTRLRVAEPAAPARMSGAASWRHLPSNLRARVASHLPRVAQSFDFRCAAVQYRMVASGECHYLLFNRLMPWDHAPGWLLHHEAGGWSAHFDGSPYLPAHFGGGLICAPDRASWQALRDALLEV
jgi:fructose-1,6-bisphosphatase/inositol monophosphatase family enzyme